MQVHWLDDSSFFATGDTSSKQVSSVKQDPAPLGAMPMERSSPHLCPQAKHERVTKLKRHNVLNTFWGVHVSVLVGFTFLLV